MNKPLGVSVLPVAVAFFISILCGLPAAAHMDRLESIDEATSNADFIVTVRVVKAAARLTMGTQCGVQYDGVIERVLKRKGVNRDFHSRSVRFGQAPGLSIGQKYLIFLKPGPGAESTYERLQRQLPSQIPEVQDAFRRVPKERQLALMRCGGLDTGLQYDNSFAWLVRSGEIEIFGLWPLSSIPSSVHINSEGPYWRLNAEDAFHYISTRK